MNNETSLPPTIRSSLDREREQRSSRSAARARRDTIWQALNDVHAAIGAVARARLHDDPAADAHKWTPLWFDLATKLSVLWQACGMPPQQLPHDGSSASLILQMVVDGAGPAAVEGCLRVALEEQGDGFRSAVINFFEPVPRRLSRLVQPVLQRAVEEAGCGRAARRDPDASSTALPIEATPPQPSQPSSPVTTAEAKTVGVHPGDPNEKRIAERLGDEQRRDQVIAAYRALRDLRDDWIGPAQLKSIGIPRETVYRASVDGRWGDDVRGAGSNCRRYCRTRVLKYVAEKWTPQPPRQER